MADQHSVPQPAVAPPPPLNPFGGQPNPRLDAVEEFIADVRRELDEAAAVRQRNRLHRLQLAERRYRRGDRAALVDFERLAWLYLLER